MSPMGPDDRKERTRRGKRLRGTESTAAHDAMTPVPDTAAYEDEAIPPRATGRFGLPPGIRAESSPELTHHSADAAEGSAAEAASQTTDPDAEPPMHRDISVPDASHAEDRHPPGSWDDDAAPASDDRPSPSMSPDHVYPGQPPPQVSPQYDRFGWPIPAGGESDESARRPVPPRGPYSGQFPTQEPAPNQPPRGPYSGQFPAQPPRQSGAFPIPPSDVIRSGQFPVPPAMAGPDDRRSGQFPAAPPNPVYQSGAYAVPPEAGTSGYGVTASGPIPQSPYISGPMPQVGEQPSAARRSGSFAYPSEVTGTGSRRVIVAPDAGRGSLLVDRSALAFLLVAIVLAGAMIAFIALRYAHFPNQIALHFGPAGSSQPNRIGEKRELWTIPFIVGIVLAANTALAWAVYRYDRFAARLLTLGCALIAAIAWVVLLTLLHR